MFEKEANLALDIRRIYIFSSRRNSFGNLLVFCTSGMEFERYWRDYRHFTDASCWLAILRHHPYELSVIRYVVDIYYCLYLGMQGAKA